MTWPGHGDPPEQYMPPQYPPAEYQPTDYQPPAPFVPGAVQQGWPDAVPPVWDGPPPPNNNKKVLAIVLPLGVLLLVAVIVAAVLATGRHQDDSPAVAEVTTLTTQSDTGSPTTTDAPTPSTTTTVQVTPPPTVPGWQVMAGGGAAIDVPPGWKLDASQAVFGIGACGTPTSFRGKVTQESDDSPDLDTGAKNIVNLLVKEYYSSDNPQIAIAPPHPTADNRLQDYKATITLTPTNPCDPPVAIVHVIAAKGDHGGTYAFAIVADQHIDGAAPEADLDQMAMTVRAAQ